MRLRDLVLPDAGGLRGCCCGSVGSIRVGAFFLTVNNLVAAVVVVVVATTKDGCGIH